MTGRTPRPQAKANRRHEGRDVARLLADFGHDLPAAPPAAIEVKEARLFHYAPRGGLRLRGRGWAPGKAPVSMWRMTSDQAPVLWPFIATPGLPPTGAQIGIDMLSGGSFYADPFGWVLDEEVPVTNPNMVAKNPFDAVQRTADDRDNTCRDPIRLELGGGKRKERPISRAVQNAAAMQGLQSRLQRREERWIRVSTRKVHGSVGYRQRRWRRQGR